MKTLLLPIWIVRFIFFVLATWMVVFSKTGHGRYLPGAVIFNFGAFLIGAAGVFSFVKNKATLCYMVFIILLVPSGWLWMLEALVFHPSSLFDLLLQILVVMSMPCAFSLWLLSNPNVKAYYRWNRVSAGR
jgi:hypothetical protein